MQALPRAVNLVDDAGTSLSGGGLGALYPAHLIVRNTFLHVAHDRPPSLDGFLEVRQVHSAPGSRLEDMKAHSAPGSRLEDPTQETESAKESKADDIEPEPLKVAVNLLPDNELTKPWQSEGPPQTMPTLLKQSTQPGLGSPELPTVGSGGHHIGKCKPCAFFWKDGCENGVRCPFCHLCEAGEKKRRAKEKKARIRSSRASMGGIRNAVHAGISRLLS